MTTQASSVTTTIINNSSTVYETYKRGTYFRLLDVLGYIPVLNTLAGLARIIGALFYSTFSFKHDTISQERANREFSKGLFEAIPVIGAISSIFTDLMSTEETKEARGRYYLVAKHENSKHEITHLWNKVPESTAELIEEEILPNQNLKYIPFSTPTEPINEIVVKAIL